jgi:mono/diheme cytochrome c family protein
MSGTLAGLLALSLAAAPAAVARAQGRDAAAAPPDTGSITPAMIASGRALFHGSGGCHNCHGEKLEGTPVAPTLRAHKWRDAVDGTLPELYRVITHGVDGTAMVPRPGGISDPQAAALASYVWAVNNRGAKP